MRPYKIVTLLPQYIQTSQLIEPCRLLEISSTVLEKDFTNVVKLIPEMSTIIFMVLDY